MIKKNQPATIELTISSTISLTAASSYWMTYKTECGTTGLWSTCTFSSNVLSYNLADNILNEDGIWKITGYVKLSTSITYPTETYTFTVYDEFDSE